MPRIFDNIDASLLPALRENLEKAKSADFCVGYFNLKGWQKISDLIDNFIGGEGNCCRLLVGMESLPKTKIRASYPSEKDERSIKKQIANNFRRQLTSEIPTQQERESLQQLIAQAKAKKLVVKLYLKKRLHAKLYLIHQSGINSIGFLGSSNLTLSGLSSQEELNIDVLDPETCIQLQDWFNQRWDDPLCINISGSVAEVVEESVSIVTNDSVAVVPSSPPPIAAIPNRNEKKKQVLQEDVSLHSDVGIDYTNLRDLLDSGDWDEADKETARVVLKVTRRQENEDWEAEEWDEENLELDNWDDDNLLNASWSRQSIENFPCSDLRTIDRLWVKYSNGRFGFSVQKNIWTEVGHDEDKFFDRLGWRVEGSILIIEEPEDLIWKLTADGDAISAKKLRKGHLPLRVQTFGNPTGVASTEMVYEYLFSRLESCQV